MQDKRKVTQTVIPPDGDGSNPGTGTIVASGDGFDVLGGHAYATVDIRSDIEWIIPQQ